MSRKSVIFWSCVVYYALVRTDIARFSILAKKLVGKTFLNGPISCKTEHSFRESKRLIKASRFNQTVSVTGLNNRDWLNCEALN